MIGQPTISTDPADQWRAFFLQQKWANVKKSDVRKKQTNIKKHEEKHKGK